MKKMTPPEIAALLEKIALPYIKTALEQEYQTALANPTESKKIQKAVKQIFSGLLRSRELSPEERRHIRSMIKNDKEIPLLPPDEEEINQTTEGVARIIVASWAQFLYLILEDKGEVLLNAYLLPQIREHASGELWESLENSFNSLPITFEQAKEIVGHFASGVILYHITIEISGFDILIKTVYDGPLIFLACATHENIDKT